MQLRSSVAIRAAIKSLHDVILPAIDTGNDLAIEQVRVVIGLLDLLSKRLPHEFRYDCDELDRLATFARALAGHLDEVPAILAEDITRAESVLARAAASPGELLDSIRLLRESTADIVGKAYAEGDVTLRDNVAALVLAHASEQLTRERAWLLPQGWEPDPTQLASAEEELLR